MLFILGVLLKLPVFFKTLPPVVKPADGFFYHSFLNFLSPVGNSLPPIYSIIAFAINMGQAFMLTNFVNGNRLMLKSNYLAGMALVIITSFLPVFNVLSAPLVASPFLLLGFILLFKSHNQKSNNSNIYNAGLLIGLSSLIFLPAALFIVFAFLALANLRPFKVTEWLLLLVGALTPYYFCAIVLFLSDKFYLPQYFRQITFGIHKAAYSLWHAGALFLLLCPLLIGIYYVQKNAGRMMVHIRRCWFLMLAYIITCIFIAFFNATTGLQNWVFMLPPIAALHGYAYFYAEWKIFPKASFWVAVLFVLAAQIFSPLW